MVPAYSHKVSRVSWYSGYRHVISPFAYGAVTLCRWSFQGHSARFDESIMRSEPRCARTSVWALSVSLAATPEITIVFFSSGYLDVSVRRVPFHTLFDSDMDTQALPAWVSPFRDLRVDGYLLLTAAYRSLSRLSSALSAKASTLRSFCLTFLQSFFLYSVTSFFVFTFFISF